MGSCTSADAPCGEPKARKLKRPSWLIEAQAVQPTGVLVYVRVAGLKGTNVTADSAPVRLLREGFVCVLAENSETDASTVKDFGGREAMLSLVPCQPSLGLVFGGFLASADLARAAADVCDALSSDSARARLEASAVMPGHLIDPESSCLLEVYAAEGIPDPPHNLGRSCPWDLHPEELPVRVPHANTAGDQPVALTSAELSLGLSAPVVKGMPETSKDFIAELGFNNHEALHIAEDHPDVLLLHQGVGDEVLDTLVRLEATCSLLEASHCCMREPQSTPAYKPPQSCFARICAGGAVKETANEMFVAPSSKPDLVEPCSFDVVGSARIGALPPNSNRSTNTLLSTSASGILTERSSECIVLSRVV